LRISINLLPNSHIEKEKNSSLLLVPVTGLVAFVAAASFLTYSYFNLKGEAAELEQNISESYDYREVLQTDVASKTTGITEYNFVEKYKNAEMLLNSIYKDTVDLKTNVYRILPEDANVDNYSYSNNGELNVTVTFASKGDAAIYLNRLLEAKFVDTAVVHSINTDSEEISYTSQFEIKLKTLVGDPR
jgi:hypothetical protein